MSRDLHGRLRQEAMRAGQSLNQLCIDKLQAQHSSFAGRIASATLAGVITAAFLDKIVVQWAADLVGLVLFGSTARGEATENSDVDLLMVMRPEVNITRALYRRWEESCLEHAGSPDCGRFSPHFVRLPQSVREAGGMWFEAALDGVVLWERDLRVSRFLGSMREAMAHGRIRRRMLHGSPYWIKEIEDNGA